MRGQVAACSHAADPRRVAAVTSPAICLGVLAAIPTVGIADTVSAQWHQAKLTASDAAAGDRFGVAVSMHGDTALVGSHHDNGTTGSAYVLARDAFGNWAQQARLSASDGTFGDEFGFSVSLSRDTALVGSRLDDGTGSAYVFVRDAVGWAQQAKLTASGAVAQDLFGISVSVSGDTALVGARNDDEAATDSGAVYVFVRNGIGSWTQRAVLTASDAAADDGFGGAVALQGDTALVGAQFDDDGGSGSGSVYVFVRDGGGNWTEQAKLTASDAAAGEGFGVSVSLSDDTALVGATGSFLGGLLGSAYVFVRDGGASWSEQAKLTASDAASSDSFARSVSILGDTALVGAPGDDDDGSSSGSAYLFVRDAFGSWNERAKLTAPDTAAGDSFGQSVSLSGDTALLGAWLDGDAGNASGSAHAFCLGELTVSDGSFASGFGFSVSIFDDTVLVGAWDGDGAVTDSGSVHVFVRNAGGRWTLQAKLTAADAAAGDLFGWSVSMSGDTALIGARGDVGGTGSAYVLVRDGDGNWAQEAKLIASDAGADDQFGNSVSLRDDTALIGAPADDDDGDASGSAYVFARDGGGSWMQEAKLTASDAAPGDLFGISVSVSDNMALIGARGDDGSTGSAYVFVRDDGGNWMQEAKLTALDATAGDSFGGSVSLSGHLALLGAPGDDDEGDDSGSAYVFVRDGGGNWTQEAKLTASDGANGDSFGGSVSLSGNHALIGAQNDDPFGSAYRFRRDANGVWTQKANLTANASPTAFFPGSVSLSGNTAVLGAWTATSENGTAYLFCGCPAALATFGTGCAGSVGSPDLGVLAGETPSIGNPFTVELTGLPFGAANTAIGILGLSRTDWGPLALPLDVGQFGLLGCTLYVSLDVTTLLPNLVGRAFWRIDIPPLPEIVGLPIYLQGGVVDFGANPANIILSSAGETFILDG